MKELKQQLIKLGYTNPELREHIEPVLDVLTQKNATSTKTSNRITIPSALKSMDGKRVKRIVEGQPTIEDLPDMQRNIAPYFRQKYTMRGSDEEIAAKTVETDTLFIYEDRLVVYKPHLPRESTGIFRLAPPELRNNENYYQFISDGQPLSNDFSPKPKAASLLYYNEGGFKKITARGRITYKVI
jgi:hypothetical protein